ncbi:MAG: class I SAM-dependent methyltransferase [bacterium]|nr:class I SAM-dependent methyltransferase [bacterium]
MLTSSCICRKNESSFEEYIVYKNETVFKRFEGASIGKCTNCGLLKTFPSQKNVFDPKQSKGELYDEQENRFTELFRPIVEAIKKYTPGGSVLDVGCSTGILLALLKKEGFKVTGIEPNKEAYKRARSRLGKDMFEGTLADFQKTHRSKFDCIIYNHVLEHIEDPIKEIKSAKNALKKGGVLVIGVPNRDNIIFFLRKKYWEALLPDQHIWHFSSRDVVKIIEKLGLKVIHEYFSDDERRDYPLKKRIYFRLLSFINKIFRTGEAVLLIFSH